MREVDDYVRANFLAKPTGIPDERMFERPVWSTWAQYKADINTSVVKQFAAEIRDNGFQDSQLEIDDNWEVCYGDAVFDSANGKIK